MFSFLQKILAWRPKNLWGFPNVQQFRWFLGGIALATATVSFAAYTNFKPVRIVDSSYAGNYTPVLIVDENGTPSGLFLTNQTAFPSSPVTGQVVAITDDSAANACDSNAGSTLSLCYWNSSTWVPIGGGAEADTLQSVFARGKSITGANSLANAARIGDGTTPICLYTDATLGPQVRPCTDANVNTIIPTNFTWSLYDIEGAAAILTVDPDAATTLAMWQIAAAYRHKKSVWFGAGSLSTDGTQCAAPAEVTPLASGVKLWTIICADNDAGRMHGSVVMPTNWDGGTFTLESTAIQTAASAGVIEYQVAAQCKGDTEALVATASYGSEVVWTDTLTGSSGVNRATSGVVTPAGTCAAGDFLAFYVDIGATNTTTVVATLHTLGFKMTYSEVGPSQ